MLFNKYFIFDRVVCHFFIRSYLIELMCCGEPLQARKFCAAYHRVSWPPLRVILYVTHVLRMKVLNGYTVN